MPRLSKALRLLKGPKIIFALSKPMAAFQNPTLISPHPDKITHFAEALLQATKQFLDLVQ
jgi:hypothetical protein